MQRPASQLLVPCLATLLAACGAGSYQPAGDILADQVDAATATESQWRAVTNPAAGAVTGPRLHFDKDGNLVALVGGNVARWNATTGAWDQLAAPPQGGTINEIAIDGSNLFGLITSAEGTRISQYNGRSWDPRTVLLAATPPSYAGAFMIQAGRYYAIIQGTEGSTISSCNGTTCTPVTAPAALQPSDFACHGCETTNPPPEFYAIIGAQISRSEGLLEWVPRTTSSTAMGQSVELRVVPVDPAQAPPPGQPPPAPQRDIFASVGSQVCLYQPAAHSFGCDAPALPGLRDFKLRETTLYALADQTIYQLP